MNSSNHNDSLPGAHDQTGQRHDPDNDHDRRDHRQKRGIPVSLDSWELTGSGDPGVSGVGADSHRYHQQRGESCADEKRGGENLP